MENFNKKLVIALFLVGGLVGVFSGHIWTAIFGFVAATLIHNFIPTMD